MNEEKEKFEDILELYKKKRRKLKNEIEKNKNLEKEIVNLKMRLKNERNKEGEEDYILI